jgi:hypothetical protein
VVLERYTTHSCLGVAEEVRQLAARLLLGVLASYKKDCLCRIFAADFHSIPRVSLRTCNEGLLSTFQRGRVLTWYYATTLTRPRPAEVTPDLD